MARWTPDPTFYPSPRLAGSAPPETLGYVALVEPTQEGRPDALGVIDLQPGSSDYGSIVSTLEMPNIGDELHHFGWNACSAALCPSAPRPHVERRYLLVPGLRSSRMHVIDTKPDPRAPQLARTIEGERHRPPHRLLAAAHDPLRPRRDLRLRARGRQRRRRGRRHLPARLRLVRPAGRLGGRPRPPALQLRLLVAPRIRHAAVQRVGHPGDVRERRRPREAARPRIRPSRARLGSAQAPPQAGARPRRPSIRWCSSCGRRTIRARPTGSSAWSCRSRICPPRSGCGTATGPTGRSRR